MTESAFRVAVYYAPELDDPLWQAGTRWLGRDPETGATLAPPETGIDALTDEPAGYGLHATLKPPMRLVTGISYEHFHDAVTTLATGLSPFALPKLAVEDYGGFLALRDQEPSIPLQALADCVVATLDPFRAQPGEAELARRRKHGLTPGQEAMLIRWGYPQVFAHWQFHITLSRRLSAEEMARAKPLAEAYVAEAVALPRRVSSLALFTQRDAGAPFLLAERFPFGG
jgi:hypothetical protein